ncbi:MAG: DUF2934 domain-containing protein [Proteobacteria bacterium]|nr:DUF2934 domain-containing protein [Pseudomonadota bacterium]
MLTPHATPLWARPTAAADHDHVVPGHWAATEDRIRLRAYFISLETGGRDPVADWLQAEAEYRAEAGLQAKGPTAPCLSWAGLLQY